MDLTGRIALVTGASGGIGSAICRRLAGEVAAIAVGYGSNSEPAEALATEIVSGGGTARAFGSDMADPGAPDRLIDDVETALGPVDILVANHGVARPARYEDLDAATFDRTLAVNLRAPFLLARRALAGMRERGFGRVLFTSSVAAFRGGVVGPDYASSKAGLHGLAHFLASRVAADGVTVNVLAPGFIATAMLPGDPQELAANTPTGRVGRPNEVADLALAILRNGYVNSQVFSIDGGMYPR
ncbi:SDR family NAD(P)-dependent oxidoreductase [Mycobacterium sp.]|jgi:3-oxoacyl-[acyl-carrier protein] reductase|uniref:SDR family NAD(P)-dependent oxidoreductase n=1 Tax=Mycobacterium sp. TaxID=1785 RepID=UPI002D339BA3|nr:SDR family NAD(P)-dependent oxidoreductase [Mycobacterium sp.]HZA12102.1 SDR family NAD(P)-dependent oxidoreductase [Mycobacterium sp.]